MCIATGQHKDGGVEFEKNKKIMVDIVSRIIRQRRGEDGSGQLEELPFIDSLLQNYSSEEKVGRNDMKALYHSYHVHVYVCMINNVHDPLPDTLSFWCMLVIYPCPLVKG